MKRILLLLALVAATAGADNSPIIWKGSNSYDLTSGGLITPKVLLPSGGTLGSANKATIVAPALAASRTLTTPAVTTTLAGFTDKLSVFAATTSSELAGVVSDETGSGALVFGTAPTITLANGTGLPVASGISGLGTGVADFLATPSSANLAAAVTGETGSGAAVFATSPALVTPDLGTPTAAVLTSATGLPLTTGVTGLLPIANGGTNKSLTLGAGRIPYLDADSFESLAAGSSGDLLTSGGAGAPTWTTPGTGVAAWIATPSSANLATALTNEIGSGNAVFGTEGSFTVVYSGPFTSSGSLTCYYSIIGKVVTLFFPAFATKAASAATAITVTPTSFPAGAYPTTQQDFLSVSVRDNGSDLGPPGVFRMPTSGNFTIFRSNASGAGTFTNSSTCGIQSAFSISYRLDS